MNQPLYIHDFAFHCALGKDKKEVFDQLIQERQFEFSKNDIFGETFYLATIPEESLPPVKNDYYSTHINKLAESSLSQINDTILDQIEKFGKERIAVIIGSCDNGSEVSRYSIAYHKKNGSFPKDYCLDKQKADFPARYIAAQYGLNGFIQLHSTACASSASVFASARRALYTETCDAAIVGGVDLAELPVILGFNTLEAVSKEPTNPFSKNRHGLTLGDASSFFVINKEPERALFKITGIGESADAEHLTAPSADGEGAFTSMKRALDDAGLSPNDIDYINLHGTGTQLNDSMEAIAVNKLFGNHKFASSTKSMTGHTLGAAGALELAFCAMTLSDKNPEGFLPVHHFDGEYDSEIPQIRLVQFTDKCANIKRCLSNSFAFGGCNVSIIIEKI